MSKTTPSVVILQGPFGAQKEAIAAGAITPGHLIQYDNACKVEVHTTAGGIAAKMFAKEDSLQGRSITDPYAAGERVYFYCGLPGDEVNALIKDGETIAIGDYLVSAGDGALKKLTPDSPATEIEEIPVAVALEACDMSGPSAADPSGRCRVQVL